MFPPGMIFRAFCPTSGCPSTNYATVSITMTDSYGDGWAGNYLAIRQNNIIVAYFGNLFLGGTSSGPI
jgi:hypothetical protein